MSRSRYTIYQTIIDIDNCNRRISAAKIAENDSHCQLHSNFYFDIMDGWDVYEYERNMQFF